ncbi:MAG TPA: metalloregulator ArsR/SmtB family transcription factor [Ktedonobacteraceae bacterium]|jgi:ArsR family transcriptional regulator|nr:metalloregulator ArsR/SmtB family transcription factor [Ktedonobacteraceae bacterium]
MEREQELELYRRQAELCQTLADPTRLELLYLLSEEPKAVKELVELLGQRQAKVSQHLALLRQRGIVRAERVGNEMHYSLADARILDACRITREILLQQLMQQGTLATMLVGKKEG